MFKNYYQLAKPGIVYGNVFTTLAAFLFATRWHFTAPLLLATVFGMVGVIASACVINNYFDRDIDARMERTKNRPSVVGAISPLGMLLYAALLWIIGFNLLYIYVNLLTALVALAGFLIYVCVYTPMKHKSAWALYPGALAGAMPIVAGYTAAVNRLDIAALWLFLFLFIWQLPHFVAIATYRWDEYRSAGVPLFVKRPPTAAAKRIARKIFLWSLVVLVAFSLALALWPLV